MKKLNKKLLISFVGLSSILLTSCTTAVATLSNGDEPFANTKIEVEGNELSEIYKIIREDSSYNSDLKTLLNYEIAKNYLGTYSINASGEIELEEWDNATNVEKVEFVKTHKAYWNWENASIVVQFEDINSISEANLAKYEERVASFKSLIKQQIIEKMFSNINSTSYKVNNKFFEALYAKSLIDNLNTIYKLDGSAFTIQEIYDEAELLEDAKYLVTTPISSSNEFTQGVIINNTYDVERDADVIINGNKEANIPQLIHIEHYIDYINLNTLPSIMTTLLTEQYILENQYSSIGRTQQRKIEYVSISDNDQKSAYSLMKSYAANYLSKEDLTPETLDLDIVVNAWKGIPSDLTEIEKTIAVETFGDLSTDWQNTTVLLPRRSSYSTDDEYKEALSKYSYIDGTPTDGYSYYKYSEYGNLIADYSTLTTNPKTNNETNYTKFTSINDDYVSPEEGLEILTDEIRAEDNITYGWGTKTDYSSLPSAIKDKLYSYGILSEISSSKDKDSAFDWQYLKSYNGKVSFLKKDNSLINDDYDSIIWSDSNTYYIVIVYDYVSPSQLTTTANSTEEDLDEIESYARDVGYQVASGSTYTNDALEYYIEHSDIAFFDQDVYDYFVTQFPDIFDN